MKLKELLETDAFLRAQIANLPKGSLIWKRVHGKEVIVLQFCASKKTYHNYLNEEDAAVYAAALEERAQRIKILKEVQICVYYALKALVKLGEAPPPEALEIADRKPSFYRSLPYNQSLPRPYTDRDWLLALPFVADSPPLYPENLRYHTAGSQMVRSKLEQSVADILFFYNLQYCYEVTIRIDGHTLCPDFIVRSPRDGTPVIIECLGLMHDEKYLRRWAEKAAIYAAGGFRPGKNMIWIFDSPDGGLDTKEVHRMIREQFNL